MNMMIRFVRIALFWCPRGSTLLASLFLFLVGPSNRRILTSSPLFLAEPIR